MLSSFLVPSAVGRSCASLRSCALQAPRNLRPLRVPRTCRRVATLAGHARPRAAPAAIFSRTWSRVRVRGAGLGLGALPVVAAAPALRSTADVSAADGAKVFATYRPTYFTTARRLREDTVKSLEGKSGRGRWWWLRLWRLFRLRKRDIAMLLGAAALALAATGLGVLAVSMLREVGLVAAQDAFIKLGGVMLLKAVLQYFSTSWLTSGCERAANGLRRLLLDSLLHQDISLFDEGESGAMALQLTNDVKELRDTLRVLVQSGLTAFARVVGAGVSLYLISPQLSGLLVAAPCMVVAGNIMGRSVRAKATRSKAAHAEAAGLATASLSNIRTVRAFGSEEYEQVRYQEKLDEASRLSCEVGRSVGMFHSIVQLGIGSLLGAIASYGGNLILRGQLTVGDLTAFGVNSINLQGALGSLASIASKVQRAGVAAERVGDTLAHVPHVNRGGGKRWADVRGDIEFREVHFDYRDGVPVLQGLSLKVPAGKVTALMDASGAGKSTMVQLLERFYSAKSGEVLVDGHSVEDTDMPWLREHIALIPQQPVLWSGTIADNISYGCPDCSRHEVAAAASKAGALEFIAALPHGFDTQVGERGSTLSGGERQRIAIARALVRNPKILLCDEATAALDATSEGHVQKALSSAMTGRTTIVIAHRLSTVRAADNIAVIGEGRVLEQGTHEELLARGGAYAALLRRQRNSSSKSGVL